MLDTKTIDIFSEIDFENHKLKTKCHMNMIDTMIEL